MKKTLATFIAVVLSIAGLHAFRAIRQSNISGKVVPPAGAETISMVNGKDTVRFKPENGAFTVTVRPGTWSVLINARKPLKDVTLEVKVKEAESTNLGEIQLQP